MCFAHNDNVCSVKNTSLPISQIFQAATVVSTCVRACYTPQMQTYSHAILTAALNRPLKKWRARNPERIPPVQTGALMLGSILPDVLLIAISGIAIASDFARGVFRDPRFTQLTPDTPTPTELLDLSMTMRLFDVWFFENRWIISAQNIFHSPLILTTLIIVGYQLWRRGQKRGAALFWIACAALLHSLIDIPLHTNDGPLLLFPFNWTYRYFSPLSYWDPNYYGREWSIFEHGLDVVLLVWLGWSNRGWLRSRIGRKNDSLELGVD